MKNTIAIMLALAAATAQAQIYKCTGPDGTPTFSGTPCAKNAKEIEVRPASGESWTVINKKREARRRREAASYIYEYEARHEAWKAREKEREERRKTLCPDYPIEARIGMTTEEVRVCLFSGDPTRINSTESIQGVTEQWHMVSGDYIYFTNGVVTAIQRSLKSE
jgi:hypothetical protein